MMHASNRLRPIGVSKIWAFLVAILIVSPGPLLHALGPENCLLIVNLNDPEGLAVANHYRVARQIPDRNIVYLDYKGNTQQISFADYEKQFRGPVLDHMKSKKLEGTIAVWITPKGFPHIVGNNSLSGVIYFGEEQQTYQRGTSPAEFRTSNGYATVMQGFQPPPRGTNKFYLHMRLDAGAYAQSIEMIDRSVRADASHPDGTVYLCDGVGPRASRKDSIPAAMQFLKALNIPVDHVQNSFNVQDRQDVLGIYTGVWSFTFRNLEFLPGALADHLTSLGGALHGSGDQMLCISWLQHGCSASYGTVIEPYNYPQKFPLPFLYVYYGLGLTAVESYWMSVIWPQQGLFVGDPLTKPFARPPIVEIGNLPEDSVVRGNFDIELKVDAAEEGAGIRKIDIYIDELLAGTMEAPPIPAGINLKASLGSDTWEYVTAGKESLKQILIAFNDKISGITPTMKAESTPSSILLVDSDPLSRLGSVRFESSSPDLLVKRNATKREVAPSIEPAQTTWRFSGDGQKGDTVELVIGENGTTKPPLVFRIVRVIPAKNLGLLMASDIRAKVPEGIKVFGTPTEEDDPLGGLTLMVERQALNRGITAMLTVKRSQSSQLKVTRGGEMVRLQDPNSQVANSLVFLQFSYGQPRVKRRLSLPSETLPDGMHTLRVVATDGSTANSTTSLVRTFVVRNGTDRLTLEPIMSSIPLTSKEVEIAKGTLAADGAAGKIQFQINGRDVAELASDAAILKIVPSQWGLGKHRLTARTKINGKDLYSENDIYFEIEN